MSFFRPLHSLCNEAGPGSVSEGAPLNVVANVSWKPTASLPSQRQAAHPQFALF